MFLFGLVTVCQGLVQNYSGLLATRFFLGLAETGMFPGSFYLIGMWYKRSEAQKRYSFFFSSTTLAGAFGGLLASAIGKMNGMRGYLGWRWIFILEGTLTCVISFAFFFLIPDFPEEAKWLNEDERVYIKARLLKDQGRSARERPIALRDVGRVFKDFKVIVAGFMYFGLIVPVSQVPTLRIDLLRISTDADTNFRPTATRSSHLASLRLMDTPLSAHSFIPYHPGPLHSASPWLWHSSRID